jgi:hypothetical protein
MVCQQADRLDRKLTAPYLYQNRLHGHCSMLGPSWLGAWGDGEWRRSSNLTHGSGCRRAFKAAGVGQGCKTLRSLHRAFTAVRAYTMADHRSAASLMRVRLGRLSGDKSWVGWWVVIHWVVIHRVVQGRQTGVWGPVDGWDACHGRWAAEFL